MKYNIKGFEFVRNKIVSKEIIEKARKMEKDFTRKRKLEVKDLILYNLNKRGLTMKMELDDFINLCNIEEISAPALLKQREKLNEDVFKYLNNGFINMFYNEHIDEVKTFKGYLVFAIDGSDVEIPNTPIARKNYKASKASRADKDRCARMKLSNCFDVLNNYIVDTQLERNKFDEIELAKRNLKNAKQLIGKFNFITLMDRGYISLSTIFHSINNNEKFIVRLKRAFFKNEQAKMKTNDEIIEIENHPVRIGYYKNIDKELYNFYKNGNKIKLRFVNVKLSSGETETLITNLDKDTFTTDDINHLYQLRWGIETNYHYLKESMKITNISSSKDGIIKQEFYSQMLVFNMLQSIQNEVTDKIEQKKYKHKMKININMAVGYIKRYLVIIMLEKDLDKRTLLYNELENKILKNIVPIRENRKFDRNKNVKNKHHINKRKSF